MTVDPSHSPHQPPTGGTNPWLIRGAVGLAVLLTLVTIGLVGWRWYHVRFPNAALFVRGDETSAGTDISVANERGVQIFSGRLSAANQYQLVVLVEQGIYNIIARQDGKILIRDRLYVPNGGGVLLNVRSTSTTQPTQPTRDASAASRE